MFGSSPQYIQPPAPQPAPPQPPSFQANAGQAGAPGKAKPLPYGGTLLTSPMGDSSSGTTKKSLLGQ